MTIRKCLTCDGNIDDSQEQVKVPSRSSSNNRYRHADHEDCARSLSGRSETSEALHRDRIRQRQGRLTNLPGLDVMEEW